MLAYPIANDNQEPGDLNVDFYMPGLYNPAGKK